MVTDKDDIHDIRKVAQFQLGMEILGKRIDIFEG
jgi:hypothetical protein